MEIMISTILHKMDNELQKAYEAKDEQALREHLLVIKTLCGLVLEEKRTSGDIVNQPPPLRKKEPVLTSYEEQEDDSNGDSLFDF
ncbi:hypothetical protein FZW96_17645 [Bacillus sp. BGMRC 2118]|nr:hypothetical protein FZW96_17645 [Bacillus sp. BGMRC 2118]